MQSSSTANQQPITVTYLNQYLTKLYSECPWACKQLKGNQVRNKDGPSIPWIFALRKILKKVIKGQHGVDRPVKLYSQYPDSDYMKGLRLNNTALWDLVVENSNGLVEPQNPQRIPYDLVSKVATNKIEKLQESIYTTLQDQSILSLVRFSKPCDSGKYLEPVVMKYFENKLALVNNTPEFSNQQWRIKKIEGCFTNTSYPILCGRLDGIITLNGKDVGVLEIKTAHPIETHPDPNNICNWLESISGDGTFQVVPNSKEYLQLQTYLHLSGLQFGLVAFYSPNNHHGHGFYGVIKVPKDSVYFDAIYSEVCRLYIGSYLFNKMIDSVPDCPRRKLILSQEIVIGFAATINKKAGNWSSTKSSEAELGRRNEIPEFWYQSIIEAENST
jgi:hypothetical protein